MNTRTARFLIVASGLALSFVCMVVAWCVPRVFWVVYRPKSFMEARDIMPSITRVAADHAWLFGVIVAAVTLSSVVCLRRLPGRVVECITVGLCAQGLVTWVAMFCYFYDGFTGLMSLHHAPRFEFAEFVSFGFGVFPVTLVLLVVPLVTALWPRAAVKQNESAS